MDKKIAISEIEQQRARVEAARKDGDKEKIELEENRFSF